MVMLFANSFHSSYYEHLIESSTQYFYEVMRIAERIEEAMKRGKIKGYVMDSRTMMRNDSEGGKPYLCGLVRSRCSINCSNVFVKG